jgi:hypothetical protein
MKIYVASSWRNQFQQGVVAHLRNAGFEVYDFKNPKPGDRGFHWSEIDPGWQMWDAEQFRESLAHPIAQLGFASDFIAMEAADACVLVLPCGRSAHLEAGYFAGHPSKRLVILLGPGIQIKVPGHSMGQETPCRACGDLDGCHLWRGIPAQEPELMYKMADAICLDIDEAIRALNGE